ncbi:alpha/beta hydrolase [Agromyces intestinalis]|uniref:Alpha/beta hydrolase n=2 Tax=Agromyces intestinalis TaxID=2592652 RepID=A0A5C1YJ32_9MICO|nr:alpha/beta hydrolase [Agromyces intestinalis]
MPRARVVLVHGIRTSATMWRNQLAPLRAHGVEVDAIDLPGHGAHLGEAFSLDAAYAAIDAALARSQAQGETDATVPRLLVGLSLGAYLAIGYAAEHPGRIDGLVAASAGTRPRGAGLAGYRALAAAIRRLPDQGRSLNDAMAALFLPADAAADIVAGGVALDVMADALGAIGTIDLEAALGGIAVPVWFVNGRWDHFRFEERRMLRAARDARLVVVPGATHLVSLVKPDHFTAAVLDAVAELDRRAARERRARARTARTRVET